MIIENDSIRETKTTSLRDLGSAMGNRCLALVMIVFLAPLMICVASCIWLADRKSVFYRGERLGKDGKSFTMLKFRTLSEDAEERVGARLLTKSDDLVTPVGKILRRYKIDELPQLFNVLRGEMNFVGPRPVRPVLADLYSATVPNYAARFEVEPGLTGLAQLRGGYYCDPRNKTRYDLLYVRHRSLKLDAILIFQTMWYIVNRPDSLARGFCPFAKPVRTHRAMVETVSAAG